jgi:SNF family Na+-dependent transporter
MTSEDHTVISNCRELLLYYFFVALLVISVVEMVSICYIYGLDNFCSDIQIMIKKPVGMFWRICWKFVSPTLLTVRAFMKI